MTAYEVHAWLTLGGIVGIFLLCAWGLLVYADGPVERDCEPDDLLEGRE